MRLPTPAKVLDAKSKTSMSGNAPLEMDGRPTADAKSRRKPLFFFSNSRWHLDRQRFAQSKPFYAWHLVCAAGLLALLWLAFLADLQVEKIVTLRPDSVWHSVAVYASKAGEGWVIAAAGTMISLLLLWGRHFEASRSVFLVAATGLLTGATATVMRSLLGRTRPGSNEVQGFYGVWHHGHWIIGKYEFGSFPSGHAATVLGLAMAAWLIDRRFGTIAVIFALFVTWSRIALGCHHFSDTVAAAIVGIYAAPVVLRGVSYLFNRLSNVVLSR